jgi:hypothetical protein
VRRVAWVHRDASVGVGLLCWTRRHGAGCHDQELSHGFGVALQAALVEGNPRIGHDLQAVLSAGTSAESPPASFRRRSIRYADELRPVG